MRTGFRGTDPRNSASNEKISVSETIDWIAALVALDRETLDADAVDETLGVVLKAREDLEAIRGRRAAELLERAVGRRLTRA